MKREDEADRLIASIRESPNWPPWSEREIQAFMSSPDAAEVRLLRDLSLGPTTHINAAVDALETRIPSLPRNQLAKAIRFLESLKETVAAAPTKPQTGFKKPPPSPLTTPPPNPPRPADADRATDRYRVLLCQIERLQKHRNWPDISRRPAAEWAGGKHDIFRNPGIPPQSQFWSLAQLLKRWQQDPASISSLHLDDAEACLKAVEADLDHYHAPNSNDGEATVSQDTNPEPDNPPAPDPDPLPGPVNEVDADQVATEGRTASTNHHADPTPDYDGIPNDSLSEPDFVNEAGTAEDQAPEVPVPQGKHSDGGATQYWRIPRTLESRLVVPGSSSRPLLNPVAVVYAVPRQISHSSPTATRKLLELIGVAIEPNQALPGVRTKCPYCGSELFLRDIRGRVLHWSHAPGQSCAPRASDGDDNALPIKPRPDKPKPIKPRPDKPKPIKPRPDKPKPNTQKPDQKKLDEPKPNTQKPDQKKPDEPKPNTQKPDQKKPITYEPAGASLDTAQPTHSAAPTPDRKEKDEPDGTDDFPAEHDWAFEAFIGLAAVFVAFWAWLIL